MIDIKDIDELEIPRLAPIFYKIFEVFGDYDGYYFKLVVDGKEKILQRRDNIFAMYYLDENKNVYCDMFKVNEEYKVIGAQFDDFEMHTISGDRVIQFDDSNNIETLIFLKRSDGFDSDGYDGTIGYIQYNQENDVRLMLLYQQMYNNEERVFSWHIDRKNPFQILIERGVNAKEKGSIIPVRSSRYIRCDYDYRDHNAYYNMAVIKDYGLKEFMEKGAYALHKEDVISRYQKIIAMTPGRYAITGFPLCSQYKYEDFSSLFKKYGFKSKVPSELLSIYNDDNEQLKTYQEIAEFMKEIEMEPPEEATKLTLKFEGNGENGTDN